MKIDIEDYNDMKKGRDYYMNEYNKLNRLNKMKKKKKKMD